MTKFVTSLSRLLYLVLMLGLGLAGLGVVVAVLVAIMGVVSPDLLQETGSINGLAVQRDSPAFLAATGVMAAACLYAGAVILQLMGLLGSAAAGTPFIGDNVRRLHVLSALFGVVLVVRLAAFLLPDTVQGVLHLSEGRLDLGTLFAALFALVLAEVFREGMRLREDAEGTI